MSPIPQEHVDTIIRIAEIEAWKVITRSGGGSLFEKEDLIQAGCEAGVAAYGRWNESESQFVTFIWYRIAGGIADYLRREDPLTRNERKAVKSGELKNPISIFSWEDYVGIYIEEGYDEVENNEALLRVLTLYNGEARDAVIAWVKLNGNCTQRVIAEFFGIHESALSRGIRQLMKEAPTLLDQETP